MTKMPCCQNLLLLVC